MAAFRPQNYLYPYYWPGSHLDKHCGGSSHVGHKGPECAAAKGCTELWPWQVTRSIFPSVIGQKGPFALHLTFWDWFFLPQLSQRPWSRPSVFRPIFPPPAQAFESWSVLALSGTMAELVTPDLTSLWVFFLDQRQPFVTVGYCTTALQPNEGKHLLRGDCSSLGCAPTPPFLSSPFVFEGLCVKDGQVSCLKCRQQFHSQSLWQFFVTCPEGTR